MRRLNSDFSDKSSENWKIPYLDIIAVGTIQFLLSLLILCYGVFLMQFILKDLYNLKTSLWTAVTFVAASKITNPWLKAYCKHLDSARRKVHKRNIIVTVLFLFGDFVFLSFHKTQLLVIILYGIFGGILSTFIYNHLQYATAEAFRHFPRLFSILDQLMKCFCLLLIPHLILFLTGLYGTTQFFLILAGTILNIIPFCLLVRTKKRQKIRLCKFQTVDRLSIEMAELNSKPVTEPSTPSSSEDEEEELVISDEKEEESDDKTEKPAPVSSSNVQKYYQNFGVKILPNIPEESDLEEDDDINEISSKRLSRISAILQEINENTRRNSNMSVNNLYQPDEIIESVASETVPDFLDEEETKKTRCFSISSNVKFDLKVKKRKLKLFFWKNIKTVPKVLKTPQFYPALISHCITTTFATIVFATAPYLMFFNNERRHTTYPNTPQESTFLLTIIGFTWLFFLGGYPVFNRLSSVKKKILFLVGLSILGLSLLVVHQFNYDNFVLFALMFGLGHGIVTYAENIANEDFCGEAKWKILQGALEITTGLFVILVYLVIYFSSLDIYVLISNGYWFYFFDVIMWNVAYFLKKAVAYCKKTGRYNVEKYSDFSF